MLPRGTDVGSFLSRFYADTAALDPEARGRYLEDPPAEAPSIDDAHEARATLSSFMLSCSTRVFMFLAFFPPPKSHVSLVFLRGVHLTLFAYVQTQRLHIASIPCLLRKAWA